MPEGPDTDRLLAGFLSVYRGAELAITERLAQATKKAAQKELTGQLQEAQRLRRDVDRIARVLDARATGAAVDAAEEAVQAAHVQAAADLAELTRGSYSNETVSQAQLDQVARALSDSLTPAHLSVTRVVEDEYRRVLGANVGGAIAGVDTQRQAMQRMLDDFARRGITGFTDRAGRRWELSAYAEMATRTAIARASLEAYAAQLRSRGQLLVRVSDSPQECPLCRPWENKILTLNPGGATGELTVEHFLTEQPMTIEVSGTLESARAAGLFHPNCTHAIAPYRPGVTKLPGGTANPEGYEARQQLRALERAVRRAKRVQAAALDPRAKKAATAQVRAIEKRIRDHVRDTEAVRVPHREQNMDGDAVRGRGSDDAQRERERPDQDAADQAGVDAAAADRAARERDTTDRQATEKAARDKARRDRRNELARARRATARAEKAAREQAERERVERERQEAAAAAELARREREATERIERERAEREAEEARQRAEKEAAAKARRDQRNAAARARRERVRAEKAAAAERARQEQEQAERDRVAREAEEAARAAQQPTSLTVLDEDHLTQARDAVHQVIVDELDVWAKDIHGKPFDDLHQGQKATIQNKLTSDDVKTLTRNLQAVLRDQYPDASGRSIKKAAFQIRVSVSDYMRHPDYRKSRLGRAEALAVRALERDRSVSGRTPADVLAQVQREMGQPGTYHALELFGRDDDGGPDAAALRKLDLIRTAGAAFQAEAQRRIELEGDDLDQLPDDYQRALRMSQIRREVLAELRARDESARDALPIRRNRYATSDKKWEVVEPMVGRAVATYPTDWLDGAGKKFRNGITIINREDRGWFASDGTLETGNGTVQKTENTFVHEIGHAMEAGNVQLVAAEEAYLMSRIVDDAAIGSRQLDKKTVIYKQHPNEQGYRDDFPLHYSGKDYGGRAWELLTTGTESLFGGGEKDVVDPDFEQFVLGMMLTL